MLRMLAILNQILEFILPAQTSFLTWCWISTYQIAIDCTPKPTQLIHPWSERCFWPPDLEIIILLHLNFELVNFFYNQISLHSSSSGWVPMLTSDPLWTIGSFVGFYPTVSFILNNLVSLFHGYIMPLVNCILCFVNHALLSSLYYLLRSLWYMFLRCPDGLNLRLP